MHIGTDTATLRILMDGILLLGQLATGWGITQHAVVLPGEAVLLLWIRMDRSKRDRTPGLLKPSIDQGILGAGLLMAWARCFCVLKADYE